jgi:hypothetical protein
MTLLPALLTFLRQHRTDANAAEVDALMAKASETIAVPRSIVDSTIQALDDWTVTYASDMCDPEHVKAARRRISEYGTLAYIANRIEALRNCLPPPAHGSEGA